MPHWRFFRRRERTRAPQLKASLSGLAALAGLVALGMPASRAAKEAPFLAENDAAMTKMMQGMAAKPNAVPSGSGTDNLEPLGHSGEAAHLALQPVDAAATSQQMPTNVSLFDQGLTQVLQASATGLAPKQPCLLALASNPDGSGQVQPLAAFKSNPAGSAIVNAIGPIRPIVQNGPSTARRYLVIVEGTAATPGKPVQVQAP